MDAKAYKKLTEGFRFIPPTYGNTDGTYVATYKHEDGRVMHAEFDKCGVEIRGLILDTDGNVTKAWRRTRAGKLKECSLEVYDWGWEPAI